jgi:hypothetical protein
MEIKKEFDNYERVEKATRELIRAVMWEHLDIAQGEKEEVLDKVIDECFKEHGKRIINMVEPLCILAYEEYYIRELQHSFETFIR